MKYINILSAALFCLILLIACNGSSQKSIANIATDSSSSGTSTSLSNATFSCMIDGQLVSGGQVSSYQGPEGYQSNQAHIVDVDQGKELLFYLSDPKSTTSQGVHSLRFDVPNKTGTSSFGPEENGWGIEVDIIVSKEHTAIYNSDSFTINIISLSATRVSGTFSGKFKLNGNINDTDKKEIEVTDGKFDIPF